jgi:hypothetical protein
MPPTAPSSVLLGRARKCALRCVLTFSAKISTRRHDPFFPAVDDEHWGEWMSAELETWDMLVPLWLEELYGLPAGDAALARDDQS